MPWSLNFNNVPSSPHPPKVDKNGNFVDESFEGVDGYPYTEGADGFLDWILGDRGANRANAFTAASQEDAQAHEFEMAQYNYQQQQALHEFNLVNDPILMAQGLKGAGLSSAAVAQALTGNTPNGYSPTVNPSGSSHGTGAQPHTPAAAQALMELPLQFAQAKLANAQAVKTQTETDWIPKLNQQQIDESAARIRQKDEELGYTAQETAARIALNNSLVNKTYEEIQAIGEEIKVKEAQINRWAHQNHLDDVESFKSFEQALLAQKQGNVADAQVGLVNAQTSLTWDQSEMQAMENAMYELKLPIATMLGLPLGSDEVSMAFMSMCTGNFGMYNDVIQTNLSNAEGTAKRFANSTLNPVDSDTRTKDYYKPRRFSSKRHKSRRSPYVNVTN